MPLTPPSNSVSPNATATEDDGERISKRLSRAGVCSRRDAERWIAEGRVAVNGVALTGPAVIVGPNDSVTVDGRVIDAPEPTRLWRYYKPAGLITSNRDELDRPTVFEALPPDLPRVVSVGRLDYNTEGLLLLTNDGGLARHLELPNTGWLRRYRVRVFGRVAPEKLAALAKGVTIDGVRYEPIEAALDREQGSNAWLTVGLREGKNREIRKVMESLELTVNRLIRVAFGPFQLGHLAEGAVEEVPRRVLKDQLGTFLTGNAETDSTPTAKSAVKSAAKSVGKTAAKPAAKPSPVQPTATKPLYAKTPSGSKPKPTPRPAFAGKPKAEGRNADAAAKPSRFGRSEEERRERPTSARTPREGFAARPSRDGAFADEKRPARPASARPTRDGAFADEKRPARPASDKPSRRRFAEAPQSPSSPQGRPVRRRLTLSPKNK